MYLVLAPFDNEQSDLVHRVHQDIILDELPVYRYVSAILPLFIFPTPHYGSTVYVVALCLSIHVSVTSCVFCQNGLIYPRKRRHSR